MVNEEVKEWADKFKNLIELERKEEMDRHESEIKNLSGREREAEGRAILKIRGRDEGRALGGKHMVKFMRQNKGEKLPENEISVGDLVMISKNDPLRDDNPTGTVSEKTNYSITVAFDERPHKFVYGKNLRVDLYVNDITFQRMLDAIKDIKNGEGRIRELRDKILGIESLEFGSTSNIDFHNEDLDDSQREAVSEALSAKDMFCIHGPPGTGKTVCCVEVIRQLIDEGEKVIATADSNTAVDNLVERLANLGVNVVRVGHPARVTPALRGHTLDQIVEGNQKYVKSQELRERAFDLKEKQEDLTHPSGRWRRGMSDDKIEKLAQQNRGSRGVPPSKIKEMAKWIDLQEEIDELFQKSDSLEQDAVDEILNNADVVCATNSTAGSELLNDREFDTVIIDEATQATEPSCLIPISLSNKVIMAGDHKQLPPTILSKKAKVGGLGKTLFERVIDIGGQNVKKMLEVQYRMHKDIQDFPSTEFYDGNIHPDKSVRSHLLSDLDHISNVEGEGGTKKIVAPSQPLVFVDTSEVNALEEQEEGSTSRKNPREAELIVSFLEGLMSLGLRPEELAVISPYDDQVDLIRRKVDKKKVEVDTVDGFQGREKEVVVLSFVRSNSEGNIGFLDDLRRLNVSITRARRKLIMVGDVSTLEHHPVYKRMIDYVKERGLFITLED